MVAVIFTSPRETPICSSQTFGKFSQSQRDPQIGRDRTRSRLVATDFRHRSTDRRSTRRLEPIFRKQQHSRSRPIRPGGISLWGPPSAAARRKQIPRALSIGQSLCELKLTFKLDQEHANLKDGGGPLFGVWNQGAKPITVRHDNTLEPPILPRLQSKRPLPRRTRRAVLYARIPEPD